MSAVGVLVNTSKNVMNQEKIVAADGLVPLVELLRNGTAALNQLAVVVLATISEGTDKIKVGIMSAGAISPLIELPRDNGDLQRLEQADRALRNVSTLPDKSAFRGGIPILVSLLRVGSNLTQKEQAGLILAELAKDRVNRVGMTAAGCIPLLVALMRDDFNVRREIAACVLSRLTQDHDQIELIAGAIEQFVALVQDGNTFEKEYAAYALAKLSFFDPNKKIIECAGGIPLLITLVRTGTIKQKNFAAEVLSNLSADERLRDVIQNTRRELL